jgi:cobalt-zinc-cadmium efflux system protein
VRWREIYVATLPVPVDVVEEQLHVWTITSGIVSLSAHVIAGAATQRAPVVQAAREVLRERFRINHVTLQNESTAVDEEDRSV